jgi:hypothetical protein
MKICIFSAVRIRVGGTCGSGVVVRITGDKMLILTNAHVVGTTIGREVSVESFWHGGTSTRQVQGTVKAAGYRSGTSLDFAFVECQVIAGAVAVPISKGGRCKAGYGQTGGSPRCELTKFSIIAYRDDDIDARIYYWRPDAIGGQSGSGVLNSAGTLVEALLTWSNGNYGMGQNTEIIYRALSEQRIDVGDTLPTDAKVACENPQPCEDVLVQETNNSLLDAFIGCNEVPPDNGNEEPDPESNLEKIVNLAGMIQALARAEMTGEVADGDFDWESLLEALLKIILEIIRNRS